MDDRRKKWFFSTSLEIQTKWCWWIRCVELIPKIAVTSNKTVTYPRYTTSILPEKGEKFQAQPTAGGNQIDYEGNVSTQTASIETIKLTGYLSFQRQMQNTAQLTSPIYLFNVRLGQL